MLEVKIKLIEASLFSALSKWKHFFIMQHSKPGSRGGGSTPLTLMFHEFYALNPLFLLCPHHTPWRTTSPASLLDTMPELPKLPAAPRLCWGLVPCMLSMTVASSQAAVKSGCFSGSTWPATHLARAPTSAINAQQFFLALSISAKGSKQGAEQHMTTEHGL